MTKYGAEIVERWKVVIDVPDGEDPWIYIDDLYCNDAIEDTEFIEGHISGVGKA